MTATDITHKIVSGEEWLQARKAFLAAEKAFTRQRDELSRLRRELPWVKVEKNYVFMGPKGSETLADLFLLEALADFGALEAAKLFLSNAIRVMAGTAGTAGGGERCVLYV